MRLIAKLAILSGSGLAASLGISLLLSGRLESIGHQVAELSFFLTLQILAVTVAKLGIDQFSFAAVSVRPEEEVTRSRAVLMASTATSLAIGTWGWFTSGPSFGAGLLMSATLDAASLIRCAQLNARGQLIRVAVSNLSSYPLFFILLVAKSTLTGFTLDSAIWLLTFCSVLRFVIVWAGYKAGRVIHLVDLRLVVGLAAFGVGNLLIHRADQVGLSLYSSELSWTRSSEQLREYLLLARFAETVSAAWPLLGVAMFPALRSLYITRRWLMGSIVLVVTPLTVAVGIGFLYFCVWIDRPTLAISQGSAFLIAGVLSFFVNFLAYLMFGLGQGRVLGVATFLVGLIGTALGWSLLRSDPSTLRWLVPTCLGLVCATCLLLLHFVRTRASDR